MAGPYWLVAPLFRFLAKYEPERDNTAMFVDSKSAVHFFIHEVTALAVLVREIFSKILDLAGKNGFIYSTISRLFRRGP